jgi:hypothetical protein
MRSKSREKRSKNVNHTRAKVFSKGVLGCQSLLVPPAVPLLLHDVHFPEHATLTIKQEANQAKDVLYKATSKTF